MKFLIYTTIFLTQAVFAQNPHPPQKVPDYIKTAIENEIVSVYSYQWGDKKLVMKKENILSFEFMTTQIDSCDFAVTGYANKPCYDGHATYKYVACVALDKKGQFKAALIDDQLISQE